MRAVETTMQTVTDRGVTVLRRTIPGSAHESRQAMLRDRQRSGPPQPYAPEEDDRRAEDPAARPRLRRCGRGALLGRATATGATPRRSGYGARRGPGAARVLDEAHQFAHLPDGETEVATAPDELEAGRGHPGGGRRTGSARSTPQRGTPASTSESATVADINLRPWQLRIMCGVRVRAPHADACSRVGRCRW